MANINKTKQTGWKDQLFLDIPAIDKQHAGFFRLLEEMSGPDHKKGKMTKQKSMLIIHRLEDYLKEHFRTEEELMKNAGYADLNVHIAQHQYFINKIEEYKIELGFESSFLLDKLLDFMKKWFLSHIINMDNLYKAEVKKMMNS